ncbi:MAG: glycosyltransferase family 1 protein [Salinivirgaceae bacterium]
MQGINIGFDAKRLFNNFTGLGNYSRTLVHNFHHYFPENNTYLFTPKTKETTEIREFFDSSYKLIQPQLIPGGFWRTFTSAAIIKKLKLDIYHGLSHELPIGISKTGAASVVTIHDLIYKTFPSDFSIIDRNIYDFKFRYACENADVIIAISESTRNDIQKYYKIPSEKIKVIYQSCHNNFKQIQSQAQIDEVLTIYKLPKQFMLYVGSVIERKNLLTLVQAINEIKDQIEIPLLVVGGGREYFQKVKNYVSEKGLEQQVIFAPPILFHHLPALYQKAQLFIYPSVYEGFGIPIIEALWSHTPVITSNCSSLPEAAGPGAYYCNPTDKNSIAEGIIKISTQPEYAQQLITNGFNYVQQFDDFKLTNQLTEVYKSIIKG